MISRNSYLKGLDYLEPLQMDLPDWMRELKKEGIESKIPIVDDDMGRFLRLVCSLKKPERILEIGCGITYATHWMLLGYPAAGVTGLDFNRDRLETGRRFLEISGFSNQVELRRVWASDFFRDNDKKYHLIFQDSTKKEYIDVLEECYAALEEGGLFIVDNVFYNGKVFGLTPEQEAKYAGSVAALEEFNQKVSRHPGFECHFLAISDGVLVAQRTG